MKPRLFYDMDNTLAYFSHVGEKSAIERMFDPGYFRSLPVIDKSNTIGTLERLSKFGYELFIITACVDSVHCEPEKREWLAEHFPFIPSTNQVFVPIGTNKAEYVKEKFGSLRDCWLIDDYNHNLQEWLNAGGFSIKKKTSSKFPRLGLPCIYRHSGIFQLLEMVA